ncbi:hypothetical protein OsI_35426 [Oryza sativa Indica Group]|uniref:NAD(+) kinase n=1 Tax=Oryza sativa subsp. indica TaxID=39946 RepID=B8BJJ6_ORYSI|nr:hypothetical protein OsI_35426 [Oryza sativa Indica Group]
MLAVCARHGPAKLPPPPPPPLAGERAAAWVVGRWWWRPAAAGRRGVFAARASFFSSRIGLDSQNYHTRDLSQLLWVGPVPGDIAEIEAFCRIFRAAEQLHTAVMSALCDPETGECPVRYDVQTEDLPVLEDKVAAVLGCMLALLNRGRKEVLSGRSGVASAFQGSEDSTMDRIPPLALFRGDLKRCCESMQVALASYLVPSQEGISRTSAMVSRWKQYVTRAERLATQNRSLNGNGKHVRNDQTEQLTNSPGFSSEGSENGTPLESDRTMEGETCDIDIETARHNLEITNSLPSEQSTEQGELHGTRTELQSNFRLESNPLKAQFPSCDVFSKKGMTDFFRSKKVYPKSVLNPRRRLNSLLISRRKQSLSAEQNGAIDYEAAEFKVLKSSNGASFDNDYILSVASGITNGKPSNNGASTSVEDREMETSVVTVDPRTSDTSNSNGNAPLGSQKSAERNGALYVEREKSDHVDGNMCASATGVVRLQSRRKAEMFLVRTDGFSCTREKVTESSLAFTHPSTQQQMLMWKSPPKTVLLLKKLGDELMEEAKEVASFLHHQEKMNVLVEPDVHDIFARIPGYGFVQTFYTQDTSDLHERVDFVACLGGDGVILHASNLFRTSVPPVVSFNLGSLGFLTSHNFEGFRQDLRAVIHGNNTLGVYITLRMRLRCEIFRNGKAMPGKVFDVLNEVVVDRGSNPYLSKIECYEHNHLITKVQGDGVIVATPTGSTAYSTAAGGSMVHPNVPCMLFTPICPHSLSFRPVILPDSARLELKIPDDARSNAWVSFDGKRRQQLSRGDSVQISMSQHPLPTVNKSDQTGDWFRSLIRCLNWNERLDQKAL